MSIPSEIARLNDAKTGIVAAIESKGVTVPDGSTLSDMGGLIAGIPSGDYVTAPETAEVGQAIVVKSVDEYGKPVDYAGSDYVVPPAAATELPVSGTALTANTIYSPTSAVGTYQFKAPSSGWAHGIFTTAASVAISFAAGSKFIGSAPSIEASKTYEFDVYNGVWAVQEVIVQ